MIVDLYELNVRELLEVQHERACDGIQRAIRLAGSFQIYMRNTIGKFKFAVSSKAIENYCKVLITLYIARTFKELIQYSANNNS